MSLEQITWIPTVPIIRGQAWGPTSNSTGHELVFSSDWDDISGVDFELVFKRGNDTIITLNQGNSRINHSGTDTIYLTIDGGDTEDLSTGPVKGYLTGASGGVSSVYMVIETEVTR